MTKLQEQLHELQFLAESLDVFLKKPLSTDLKNNPDFMAYRQSLLELVDAALRICQRLDE